MDLCLRISSAGKYIWIHNRLGKGVSNLARSRGVKRTVVVIREGNDDPEPVFTSSENHVVMRIPLWNASAMHPRA